MNTKKSEFKNIPWTLEEINVLNEYNTGSDIKVLAEKINRTPNAVAQKLLRVGLIKSLSEARGYEPSTKNRENKPVEKVEGIEKVQVKEKHSLTPASVTKLFREITELKKLVLELRKDINKTRIPVIKTHTLTNSREKEQIRELQFPKPVSFSTPYIPYSEPEETNEF